MWKGKIPPAHSACGKPGGSSLLSACRPAQDDFQLHSLSVSSSSSLHLSLQCQASFIPPTPTFPRGWRTSFCLFNMPPWTSRISPHGLTTHLQPLTCNWLPKTYQWGLENTKFSFQRWQNFLVHQKNHTSFLKSPLPNTKSAFNIASPVLLL